MSFEGARPGAAWLSSARVVRCSVQSGNERNPHEVLYMSLQTALSFEREAYASRTDEREEGGDDVKSAWPFDTLGYTRATMADIKGCQIARWS